MSSNYFSKTELIVDLTGPIIDITKIPDFNGIESIRYLTEEHIAQVLTNANCQKWTADLVLKASKDAVQSNFRMNIIDRRVVELLCRAKSFGAAIHIFSSAKDDGFYEAARDAVIEFTQIMAKEGSIDVTACLTEADFVRITLNDREEKDLPTLLHDNCEENSYRIVFDDEVDSGIFTSDQMGDMVAKWISGCRERDYAEKLEFLIEERERIAKVDEAINNLTRGKREITVGRYAILNKSFYVYDKAIMVRLQGKVEAIKAVVNSKTASTKPICVLLAGAPGTGKSYFVKLFSKYINAKSLYPTASLSGIPESQFTDAVRSHIRNVYCNSLYINQDGPRIAFLDEVDTKGGAGVLAFRFLMDAMTGSYTNEKGEFEANETERLVWIFALSAVKNANGLISRFPEERKVGLSGNFG